MCSHGTLVTSQDSEPTTREPGITYESLFLSASKEPICYSYLSATAIILHSTCTLRGKDWIFHSWIVISSLRNPKNASIIVPSYSPKSRHRSWKKLVTPSFLANKFWEKEAPNAVSTWPPVSSATSYVPVIGTIALAPNGCIPIFTDIIVFSSMRSAVFLGISMVFIVCTSTSPHIYFFRKYRYLFFVWPLKGDTFSAYAVSFSV